MIALIQRVNHATVHVNGALIGAIDRGILALVGMEQGDTQATGQRLLARVLGYRIFPDGQQRMNRSLIDIAGALLLVPQFTLVADTNKGTRPSFSSACLPEQGEVLFEALVAVARSIFPRVASGCFGADMQVGLINDGPVTFCLRAAPRPPAGRAD